MSTIFYGLTQSYGDGFEDEYLTQSVFVDGTYAGDLCHWQTRPGYGWYARDGQAHNFPSLATFEAHLRDRHP
jgi:hypothetical protein